MEHLAALGHRRFLHIAGPADFPSARSRRQAYLDAVARLGLESIAVVEGDWSGDSGAEAIDALPSDAPPLAVIAANDLVATGAIRAATRRGWRLPAEVAVTGWDDHAQSAFLVPSLTTVSQDRERLGTSHRGNQSLYRVRPEPPDRPDDLLAVVWRESTESPRRQ